MRAHGPDPRRRPGPAEPVLSARSLAPAIALVCLILAFATWAGGFAARSDDEARRTAEPAVTARGREDEREIREREIREREIREREARQTGPRLILPGDRAVQPGQWISLAWTPADSVSELEILLSLDGGRHYTMCISPRLEPRRCEFIWRVPWLAPGTLTMRIRFNRGGREIEGAPAAPLLVHSGTGGDPQPLALPLESEPGSSPQRAAGDRAGSPQRAAAPGLPESSEAPPGRVQRDPPGAAVPVTPGTGVGPTCTPGSFAAPRSVPLRT